MPGWTRLLLALLIALPAAAAAQDYPTRPITLIVPFPAGGGVDAMARIIADRLSAALGQQIIIDNRGGAAGVIGSRIAARATPDGYTLVMGTTGTTGINPTLYVNPGYDPRKDFAPIGLIATTPVVLMAHPSFPPRTVAELIALAKSQQRKIDVGTPPPGTENYLAVELFKSMTGIDLTIVTYKGTGPLTNDLLGGHVLFAFNTIPPALGNLQSGDLRAMAVAGRTRSSLLPDVPTVIESGLPGFEASVRYGLMAPAGTPQPIIDRLARELRQILGADATRARISGYGSDVLISTPDEYAADIARETARWGALIKKLGLRVD